MAQINKPTDYFNTKLFTGTGSSNSVTGVGFQPDWVWLKDRGDAANHFLFDSVRGVTKAINSNTNFAESTQVNALTAFGSDGFTVGSDGDVNGSGDLIASWNWLASNTSGSSNTDGSITSTVSANTTSGFSIVSYTGTGSNATVGHGLGAVPKMIIVKLRSSAGDWTVYNSVIGNTNFLRLNSTLASTSQATYWNNTSPTSSVFTVGSAGDVNTSSGTHIAYCFAEKKGYSKFGSYVGNNSNDGSFIYTGFKPAWVLIKRYDAAASWFIFDNKRDTDNPLSQTLLPNLSNAEGTETSPPIDFLSNGFKMRYAHPNFNTGSYIYMAFAENPLVGTNNIPATAR